jgi:small membrane protein
MNYTSPIQIILALFLVFALSRVYLRAKGGELRLGEFLFWGGLFTFALIGVIEPQFTNYVARKVGIGRGADVVIYAGIALLFYLIFRTNVLMENMKNEITRLTRRMALYEHEHETKKTYEDPDNH